MQPATPFSSPHLDDSFHQDKAAKIFSDGITTAEQLFNKSAEWSEVKCSELTRYGILSVTHNATKIKCRMIFGTGVPVRNTKVVQSLFDAQPVCKCDTVILMCAASFRSRCYWIPFSFIGRQLVICIQSAMYELNNLSFQRFKNGYVASMLVLFYFQKQGKLPSVKSMQEGCTARMKCGGKCYSSTTAFDAQVFNCALHLRLFHRKCRRIPKTDGRFDLQRSVSQHFDFILQVLFRIWFCWEHHQCFPRPGNKSKYPKHSRSQIGRVVAQVFVRFIVAKSFLE